MSLAAGMKFGPYEIIAPLGAGAMGEVYRAKDRGWTALPTNYNRGLPVEIPTVAGKAPCSFK
jgi:hypothetical protein